MRAVYILAAVALVLFLVGQVRVGGRAEFNAQGFFLWVRLGLFQIKILPMSPKEEKPAKPQKPKKKKEPQKPKKEKEPVPLPEKIGGALEYAQELLPVVLEAGRGMWRGLRVDTLELELTAGGSDPADAAMLYGRANAVLGALWSPLTEAFHVKEGAARVKLDFDALGTTVYGQAALSIKIGTVTWVGMRACVKTLFRALAARKRLKIKRQQRKAV
ncbi:MAG: DUF2953 domain-containing protein [Lawsonibacter sp.]|jgi:hypothetical protein|nr:DUF2953 domain-containing protein [Lawsonibacter sp.]